MVLPLELTPEVAMSAPFAIRTGSWKRLSGVRFSWKIMTTCSILPVGGGVPCVPLDAPHPFKLNISPAAHANKHRLINSLDRTKGETPSQNGTPASHNHR